MPFLLGSVTYVLGHSSSLGSGIPPLGLIPQEASHQGQIDQNTDDQSNPESLTISSPIMNKLHGNLVESNALVQCPLLFLQLLKVFPIDHI